MIWNLVVDDCGIWMVEESLRGLVLLELFTFRVLEIYRIADEVTDRLYTCGAADADSVYMMDSVGKHIMCFNKKQKTFSRIMLDEKYACSGLNFRDCILRNNKIYFFPFESSHMVVYDITQNTVSYIDITENAAKWASPCPHKFYFVSEYEGVVYGIAMETGCVCEFDGAFRLSVKGQIDTNLGYYNRLVFDGESYYALWKEKLITFKSDMTPNVLLKAEFDHGMTGFLNIGNEIIVAHIDGEELTVVNKVSGKISYIRPKKSVGCGIMWIKEIDENYAIAVSSHAKYFGLINVKEKNFEWKKVTDFNCYLGPTTKKIMIENEEYSLKEYISYFIYES